jgi:hypothetical protein
MKVAWLHSQQALGGKFSARDIVAMATCDAARILKWDHVLGAVEAGKRADLLVVSAVAADPYGALISAKETDIALVMINGIARFGVPALMQQLATDGETMRVGGQVRQIFLKQATADPDVAQVPLGKATSALTAALHDIAALARETEKPVRMRAGRTLLDARSAPVWSLALDEICSCGVELAPRLPYSGPRDFTGPVRAPRALTASAPPLSTILQPIELDPLTVADDANFLERLLAQPNVPAPLKAGLRDLL